MTDPDIVVHGSLVPGPVALGSGSAIRWIGLGTGLFIACCGAEKLWPHQAAHGEDGHLAIAQEMTSSSQPFTERSGAPTAKGDDAADETPGGGDDRTGASTPLDSPKNEEMRRAPAQSPHAQAKPREVNGQDPVDKARAGRGKPNARASVELRNSARPPPLTDGHKARTASEHPNAGSPSEATNSTRPSPLTDGRNGMPDKTRGANEPPNVRSPLDLSKREFTPPPGGSRSTPDKAYGPMKRQVTVFYTLEHETGEVVTGWIFKDGSAEAALVSKYCYFTIADPNGNEWESKRVNIAVNGQRLPNIKPNSVPDLNGALAKCHWVDADADPVPVERVLHRNPLYLVEAKFVAPAIVKLGARVKRRGSQSLVESGKTERTS